VAITRRKRRYKPNLIADIAAIKNALSVDTDRSSCEEQVSGDAL